MRAIRTVLNIEKANPSIPGILPSNADFDCDVSTKWNRDLEQTMPGSDSFWEFREQYRSYKLLDSLHELESRLHRALGCHVESAKQDPCQKCGRAIAVPNGSACSADPCPHCRYPRPLGDCSDLTIGPPRLERPTTA